MEEFHEIRKKKKKKGIFPHIGQDLGKQPLEEKGRHTCVKSKTAISRIMENTNGRGGEELRERSRRKEIERAERAEKTEAQKRLCTEGEKRLNCERGKKPGREKGEKVTRQERQEITGI